MNTNDCPECKSACEYREEGSTKGLYCDNCGWSVVTTNLPAIDEDTTKYAVVLVEGDPDSIRAIKAVAAGLHVNFLEAKNLLSQPGVRLFSGAARETQSVLRVMASADVQVTVEPTFPHGLA